MSMAKHKQRYPGTRWMIRYGSAEGVEQFALTELQRTVQRRLPYVVGVYQEADRNLLKDHHVILLGTVPNNPRIAEWVEKKRIAIPAQKEGYAIACQPSPWGRDKKLVVIAGQDAAGVLYGVQDFNARIVGPRLMDSPARIREGFDHLPEFSFAEHPLIEDRGIWTWGYVIYDYRRFFDNMARLRMNMVTIWNDCPPLNCPEVIDYAHRRGIRVILGFSWGWGYNTLDLSKARDRAIICRSVVEDYRSNYRHLDLDGIYFQTLTEHSQDRMGGKSVAAWARDLVNETARELFEEQPDLFIQFGLHATSIRQNYRDLGALDSRITITWEDAGTLPYSYDPPVLTHGAGKCEELERTVAYSRKLATFRKGTTFAMIPKGWINLRWGEEFEHHGPFILGERDPEFIRARLRDRQSLWDRVNVRWLQNYPQAAMFYRTILACRPSRMTLTGLVEDGVLEEMIQPSVALFAETIWNPRRSDREILERAMSPYYRRGW